MAVADVAGAAAAAAAHFLLHAERIHSNLPLYLTQPYLLGTCVMYLT